jgi:hypothetical protein
MGWFADLRDKVITSAAEKIELEQYRQRYRDAGGQLPRKNQWYRITSAAGALLGFEFACACGQVYPMMDMRFWLQSYRCPQCKTDFDLFRACGIASDTPREKWLAIFAKLPTRQAQASASPSPYKDVWADSDAVVEWAGSEPHAPDGWK